MCRDSSIKTGLSLLILITTASSVWAEVRVRRTFRPTDMVVARHQAYRLDIPAMSRDINRLEDLISAIRGRVSDLSLLNDRAHKFCLNQAGYDRSAGNKALAYYPDKTEVISGVLVRFNTFLSSKPQWTPLSQKYSQAFALIDPQYLRDPQIFRDHSKGMGYGLTFDSMAENTNEYYLARLFFPESAIVNYPSELFADITCEGDREAVMKSYLQDPNRISDEYARRTGGTPYTEGSRVYRAGSWEQLSDDRFLRDVLDFLMKQDGVHTVAERSWLDWPAWVIFP